MLKNLGLAMVAVSLLAIPAAARNGQKGAHNNNGTTTSKQLGQARAEEVQTANNKGDKDNTPSKGSKRKDKKTRTRKGWAKNAEHNANAKGHSK
jgi:hypothetical protein